MNARKHPLIDDPRLTAFVLGELEPGEMSKIQAVIDQSPELQQEVEQIRIVWSKLQDKFAASSDQPQLTDDQKARINETIEASESANAETNPADARATAPENRLGPANSPANGPANSPVNSPVNGGDGNSNNDPNLSTRNRRGVGWRFWAIAASVLFIVGAVSIVMNLPANRTNRNLAENDTTAISAAGPSAGKEGEMVDEMSVDRVLNPTPKPGGFDVVPGTPRTEAEIADLPMIVDNKPNAPLSFKSSLVNPGESQDLAPLYSLYELGQNQSRSAPGFGYGGGQFGEVAFGGDQSISMGTGGDFERVPIAADPQATGNRMPVDGGREPKNTAFYNQIAQIQERQKRVLSILESTKEEDKVELKADQITRVYRIANLNSQLSKASGRVESSELALKSTREILNQQSLQMAMFKQLAKKEISEQEVDLKLAEIEKDLEKLALKLNVSPAKTWKRVKAVPNASRLMLGDQEELSLTGMQVNVQIDGFRARVVIDYFYYNDRDRQLEGSFKLRLPNEASPYYFAFGESRFSFTPDAKELDTRLEKEFLRPAEQGERFVSLDPVSIRDLRKGSWDKVKEARMVPREKAAFAYQQTTRRRIDPALVEWAGAGVFNAKVFPLAPRKLHRIVVGYDVNLAAVDDRWVYQLALPEQSGDCLVDVRVSSTDQVEVAPAVELDKFDGTANFRLDNPAQREFALSIPAENGTVLKSLSDDEIPFFATQIQLPLASETENASGHAVFLVDTSLSAEPEKFNLWLKMMTRLLNQNRDVVKRFSVVFFNVEAYWWKENYVDNNEQNVDELMKYCNRLALEGATDLYSAIRLTTHSPWLSDRQNVRPDLFLLSDGAATWGETNLQLIGRQLESKSIGSLFAYQAGMTGTSIRALQFLTAKTGGAVFSVAGEDEAKAAARAHRKKPWRLISVSAQGAEDILTAGRVQWVYPNQRMLLVGRGEPGGDFEFKLQSGTEEKTLQVPVAKMLDSELAYRAYGQVSVGQLENLGDAVNKISTAYARNFRVTGQTCSLLMLDSEADYQRFNIKPEDDQYVVSAKHCSRIVNEQYARNHAALADPKQLLMLWLKRLESAPQINFKIPTALELALDQVSVPVVAGKLNCQARFESDLSPAYLQSLEDRKLKYDQFIEEAKERRGQYSEDDAIKVLSNLIEQNPGDLQLLRDVAFMAMEFEQPEQAYPLLKKVAMARPYNAVVYTALAKCLVEMGNVDLAMVFYEIAVTGTFQKTDFRRIAATEYVSLLAQIERGEHQTALRNYAKSRIKTLLSAAPVQKADLVVTMMWNTDRTDVDLHIIDAAGEECNYQHPKTRMGGRITGDVTDGYGPEMFWLPKATSGRYQIKVNYFGSDNLRSGMRSKVHLTIYRNFGTPDQVVTRKTVQLGKTKEMRTVTNLRIK